MLRVWIIFCSHISAWWDWDIPQKHIDVSSLISEHTATVGERTRKQPVLIFNEDQAEQCTGAIKEPAPRVGRRQAWIVRGNIRICSGVVEYEQNALV